VTVNLLEVNKAPAFPNPTMALSVYENAAPFACRGLALHLGPERALPADHAHGRADLQLRRRHVPRPSSRSTPSTGAITVASGAQLDLRSTPTYSYAVVVSDSGWDTQGVLSASGTVVISLVNRQRHAGRGGPGAGRQRERGHRHRRRHGRGL
jgi:hypothetical protein